MVGKKKMWENRKCWGDRKDLWKYRMLRKIDLLIERLMCDLFSVYVYFELVVVSGVK